MKDERIGAHPVCLSFGVVTSFYDLFNTKDITYTDSSQGYTSAAGQEQYDESYAYNDSA